MCFQCVLIALRTLDSSI